MDMVGGALQDLAALRLEAAEAAAGAVQGGQGGLEGGQGGQMPQLIESLFAALHSEYGQGQNAQDWVTPGTGTAGTDSESSDTREEMRREDDASETVAEDVLSEDSRPGNARLIVTHEGLLDESLLKRMEGYMYKKGGAVNARGGFRNWKKRWFVIASVEIMGAQGYELQYYDKEYYQTVGTLKGKIVSIVRMDLTAVSLTRLTAHHLSPATYHLSPATCHLPPTT
ncbi:hypothetical protein B484DRAFT_406347 [Ochromonadaceae sp. CCMP2298]|nr:hypothetical protein B484DRAFT_406347 [Ochromonadaceae sp. CCMP2298]